MPRVEDMQCDFHQMDLGLGSPEGKECDNFEEKCGSSIYEDEDEVMYCSPNVGSREDIEFDEIVGALEEIIMDPKFSNLQNSFCGKHCDIFEDTEENKLEYTDIFNDYTNTIETYIERRLTQAIKGFRMDRFALMCQKRKDEISGDVFDILLSCGDFAEFKFLMLSHKNAKNGNPFYLSGSNGLCV